MPKRPSVGHRVRRRLLRWWRNWQWPFIAALALGGIVLGYVGYSRYYADTTGWTRSPLDFLFYSLQLLALEFNAFDRPIPWELHVARFLLPAVAGFTAVKAVVALYSEQLQNLVVRLFVRDHTVVCGLGERGLVLTRQLRRRGQTVVVVEQDAENDQIGVAREEGATVIVGDATDEHALRRAGVCRARHVVATCQDDGRNAEIGVRVCALAGHSGRLHSCICHVFGSRLRRLIDRHRQQDTESTAAMLRFFSVYEYGAEVLLELDQPFSADPAIAPHIMVLGIGRMGEALLVRLAELWKSGNGDDGARLRIVVGDRAALEKRDFLLSEYPDLARVWQLEPVKVEVKSPEFQAGVFLREEGRHRTLTRVYVCLDDDSLGLAAALTIEDRLKAEHRQVPIVLRTRTYGGLAVLMPRVDDPRCPPNCLKAFGLLDHTCTPDAIAARR